MHSCSDRSISPEPPLGPRRRCRQRSSSPCCDADGKDGISGLPDSALLRILAGVRCARTGARAGGLSRRWRGLWTRLPEVHLHGLALDAVVAALAQVALPELSILDINVPKRFKFSAADVASLLRTAARLAPVELTIIVLGNKEDINVAVELPGFDRATSIRLELRDVKLAPAAPGGGFSMSFSAPMVENLFWHCLFSGPGSTVGINGRWSLKDLMLSRRKSGYILHLVLYIPFQDCKPFVRKLQEIVQLPVISVLELRLLPSGHSFGSVVLNLLAMFTSIQSLKLDIERITDANQTVIVTIHKIGEVRISKKLDLRGASRPPGIELRRGTFSHRPRKPPNPGPAHTPADVTLELGRSLYQCFGHWDSEGIFLPRFPKIRPTGGSNLGPGVPLEHA